MNYGHCVSFGLSGCDINDPDATYQVTDREGISGGYTDDPGYDDFRGSNPTTTHNIGGSAWFDRCPKSKCGYKPPVTYYPPPSNSGPACDNGFTVFSAYIDSGTGDDGCRPPSCPFGRRATGWCEVPASDDPPIVYVAGPHPVAEDGGSASFLVALSHPYTSDVTVDASTADGTATAGSDYTAVASQTVTVTAGQRSTTVPVVIIDDTDEEEDETFTLSLSNPTGSATLSVTPEAEATITDDDGPTVAISGPSAAVDEGGTLTYTVSLTRPAGSTDAVSVEYAASGTTATGAPAGQGCGDGGYDYAVAGSGVLTWGEDESGDLTVVVIACADSRHPESDEIVTVTLSNPSPSNTTFSRTSATGTIVSKRSYVDNLSLTCRAKSNGAGYTLTFSFDAREQYIYRTWTNDADRWIVTPGPQRRVTYTQSVTRTGVHTAAAQRSENPGGGRWWGDRSKASTVCEALPQISVSDATAVESARTADFTVTLSKAWASDVTVDVATSDGTATAGSDYTAASRTVTISAGSTTTTVSVPITPDTDTESDETFTLTLSNPTGATLGTSTATGTITDDDDSPVTVSFGQASYTAAEGGAATVTVALSAAPGRIVTIPIVATDQGGATSGDYSGVPASVTFTAAETSKMFTFTAVDDTDDDDGESVKLSFGVLPNAVSAGTPSETTIAITDDDTQSPNDGWGL